MFRSIIGLLLLFWVLGLVFRLAGAIIHLLLIAAVILFVVKVIRKKFN